MSKFLVLLLSLSAIVYNTSTYSGGTLAPTIIAGSVVKYTGAEIAKKYKRKDCPVCKGTGKYLSGDTISWVDCGYCEPSTTDAPPVTSNDKTTCANRNCVCKNCKCKKCGCLPSVK